MCVSGTAKESLIGLFPELESKAVVMHNVIDPEAMRSRADGEKNPYGGYDDLLNVGHGCAGWRIRRREFFACWRSIARLHEAGLNFRLVSRGGWPRRRKAKAGGSPNGKMADRFILLGEKEKSISLLPPCRCVCNSFAL